MKKLTIIALIVVILDQITKFLITSNLVINEQISVIEDLLYITYVKNYGAAWSIISGNRLFLIFASVFAIVLIVFYIIKEKRNDTIELIAFGMLVGGALGNLIDRVIHGFVIDFIKVIIIDYHYPVFNVSDIFIVIGALIFIISVVKSSKIRENENKN